MVPYVGVIGLCNSVAILCYAAQMSCGRTFYNVLVYYKICKICQVSDGLSIVLTKENMTVLEIDPGLYTGNL